MEQPDHPDQMDFQVKRVKEENWVPLVLLDCKAPQDWLDKLDLKDPRVCWEVQALPEDPDPRVILAKTEEMEWTENLEPQDRLVTEENLVKMELLEFRVLQEKRDQLDCLDRLVYQATKVLLESRVIQ